MGKAKEIIDGISNSINKKDEIEKMAKNRLAICYLCDKNNNGKCGVCGCYLNLKARSPKSNCPENKW